MTTKQKTPLEDFFGFMADRPQIKKDTEAYKYKYADATAVDEAVRAPLTKHNLMICYEMKDLNLIAKLVHKSGKVLSTTRIPFSEEFFKDAQKLGSAMTYYRRYAKLILLDLIVEGDDDDGAKASAKKTNVKPLNDPGEFILTLTKNKGKKLKELSHQQLEWYAKEFTHEETNTNAVAHLEQRIPDYELLSKIEGETK